MAKDLAIILNSGSVNSVVVTAMALQKYRPILLHAEIVQQQGSRVRAAYDQQVAHFKPYREHTLPMPFLAPVTDTSAQGSFISDPRVPAPLAPLMLEMLPLVAAAARYAAHYQASAIYLGTRVGGHGDELAQATEYFQIWNELIQLPCGQPELEVVAPLLELEPWQVVDVGFQVNAPFDKTWSCSEDIADPCWACRSCRAREAAFQQAGKPDPMRPVRKL
jgi:7-cyano-7-deazaguanine synthase in queuosine biosynthesis